MGVLLMLSAEASKLEKQRRPRRTVIFMVLYLSEGFAVGE
jgi:hypothetical protein